jgi:hypothetical protein
MGEALKIERLGSSKSVVVGIGVFAKAPREITLAKGSKRAGTSFTHVECFEEEKEGDTLNFLVTAYLLFIECPG